MGEAATAKLLPRSNGEKWGLAAVEATVDGVDNPCGVAPGFGESRTLLWRASAPAWNGEGNPGGGGGKSSGFS